MGELQKSMNQRNNLLEERNSLIEKINSIKQDAYKRKNIYRKEQLSRPISYWIKNDRLLNEIGKTFTIILRTRGCSWALSKYGGCSMCGYYLDANNADVPVADLIEQFNYAFDDKINEIKKDTDNFVFKLFNSGSFLDEKEIPKKVRTYIYEKISKLDKIKEVVIESRVEYITKENLEEISEYFEKKHFEIAIGLETVDDYIRNNYINKGLLFKDFRDALKRCKDMGIGVKVYLLFKPLFLNEQAAIDDCSNSIQILKSLGVNSISINPMNIQKGTLTEYLWFQKRYRPPWFYSLFKCIKKTFDKGGLNNVRILSDPSGAGTKRGIHNCLKKKCENSAKTKLKNFVLTQDITELEQQEYECDCKKNYSLTKDFH